jgi:hypothetical protein
MSGRLSHLSLLVVIVALVAGCAPAAPPPPSPTLAAPTATPSTVPVTEPTSVPSPVPATAPAVATPVLPSPVPASPVPPTDTPPTMTVQVFLIALEDNGRSGKPVGCGDSAVPVQVTTAHTQAVLKAALEALLSVKEPYYGQSGLYNALYQSDLRLDSATIKDGLATIHLSGRLLLGGVCDNPRVEAQITETALQFSTVGEVAVFVNDVPLEEVLSEK